MRLATRSNGTPDGELLVISKNGARGIPAGERWPNLLAAIENWDRAGADLRGLSDTVETGAGEAIDPDTLRAPFPRSWQWLDGSAFAAHGELMQIAFKTDPIVTDKPLMYQGMSDRFYGPYDPVPFRR
eukprot:gene65103-biopygen47669